MRPHSGRAQYAMYRSTVFSIGKSKSHVGYVGIYSVHKCLCRVYQMFNKLNEEDEPMNARLLFCAPTPEGFGTVSRITRRIRVEQYEA